MPELPEVETVRRTLIPRILDRQIERAWVHYPRLLQNCNARELASALEGHSLQDLERRGKYLIGHLDSGLRLVMHLRMTGRLLAMPGEQPLEKHTSLQLALEDGWEVRLVDQRKFATLHLLVEPGYGPIKGLASLGVEPLGPDFTPAYFKERLARRQAPIKAVLLDQRLVAGLGNIYADESLHRAGIRPARVAHTLQTEEIRRLHGAIQAVLAEGIRYRGTTFRDYVDGTGRSGGFQEQLRVYGRSGETCLTCGQPIAKTKISGRGNHYCPHCQV